MVSAKIAIVGRPNVGKSALFNRLIGRKVAIIAEEAGTTRDRVQQPFVIDGYHLELIDTGGLLVGKKKDIEADVEKQAKIAMEEADIILFVVDAIQPLTSDDSLAASILRKTNKPIIFVANKCDHPNMADNIYNVYELGFGEPIKVSSIHKIGIENLQEEIAKTIKKLKIKKVPTKTTADPTNSPVSVTIIGRPNVGKSSLVNALLGEERMIVSNIPGTTRDSQDIQIRYKNTPVTLVDTAGLRKRGKIEQGIEKWSSLRCKESVEKSDVVIAVMDGTEPATSQDLHVLEIALKEKKGIIIAVNKDDLIKQKEVVLGKIAARCEFLPWAPVVFISAKEKTNIWKLIDLAIKIGETRKIKVTTTKLNNLLQKTIMNHFPASTQKLKTKFFYGTQTGTNPPKFSIVFRNAKSLHFSYRRYIENTIRKEFGFEGTPIGITLLDSPSKPAKNAPRKK